MVTSFHGEFIVHEGTNTISMRLGVYLTERTIKLLGERCPHLKVLNLHDASYLMTDHFMEILCKVRHTWYIFAV